VTKKKNFFLVGARQFNRFYQLCLKFLNENHFLTRDASRNQLACQTLIFPKIPFVITK
jgi:hypothetical protein